MSDKMTYRGVGVDYDAMDPFKRMAQLAGRQTAHNLVRFEMEEVEASRGESAYVVQWGDSYLAHVQEGLGTKNLVADAMYRLTGRSFYDHIAQDTVAMIVNDMITVGAMPIAVAMHLAAGDADWFKDEQRSLDLVLGWQKACNMAGCVWGGGETPTLKDIIAPGAVELSGSAFGLVEKLIDGSLIEHDDRIVLVRSSGIHANGLTLARKIAAKLSPDAAKPELGYLTDVWHGRTFGEALLEPTHIYVDLVRTCFEQDVDLHYAVNITGHGWRKLMRAKRDFAYIIMQVPEPHGLFTFMQRHGNIDDEEAYGNLNMGAGFALYVPHKDVAETLSICGDVGFEAVDAGRIVPSTQKYVWIDPLRLEYKTLGVR